MEIAQVVFEVVGGVFYDGLSDFILCLWVCDAKSGKEVSASGIVPAVIVYADVHQGEQAQIDRAV